MPTFKVYIAIECSAPDAAHAAGIAEGAAQHLVETFNDDGSLRAVYWNGPDRAIIDRSHLQSLVDGADFGQVQKSCDADRYVQDNGRDGVVTGLRRTAVEWRKAVRAGLSILRTTEPPKARTHRATQSQGDARA